MRARPSPDPFVPFASRAVVVACVLVLAAALVGAAVRLLPWALDPTIAWATLAPFAKSLAAVAVEAALLMGWPVGWALATQRLVDRGEARVLASLGEGPGRTCVRLVPTGVVLAVLLAATSTLLGREAAAPGRVVNALLAEGRAVCAAAQGPSTFGVPFVSATWLCPEGGAAAPLLVGRAPVGAVAFAARGARVSDDLRRIELDDARLAMASAGTRVRIRVATLTLRGLAPWARASALPPGVRALVVGAAGLVAAFGAVLALLRLAARQAGAHANANHKRVSAVVAVAVGASGPVAALLALRGLELRVPDASPVGGAWLAAFALVPAAAAAAVAAAAVLVTALPERRRAGSK
jgi:hypothetical protein